MIEEKNRGGRPKNPPVDLRSSNPEITLIDAREAAWLLRWDVTTVRRKIVEGAIPATANPRNPQTLAEANGLGGYNPASKNRYRIQKVWIARQMYGNFIDGILQPMTEQEQAEALDKLNAALREYESLQEKL